MAQRTASTALRKLDKRTVACRFDYPAVMLRDLGIDYVAAVCL